MIFTLKGSSLLQESANIFLNVEKYRKLFA